MSKAQRLKSNLLARGETHKEHQAEWVDDMPNTLPGPFAENAEGILANGVFELHPTGLKITGEITEDSWFLALAGLQQIKRTYQWMLADLLRYGFDRKYGETRQQEERIAQITGLSPERLSDLASLAGKYEISSRNENLDMTHHRLCAALPSAERDKWLSYADDHKLSVADLDAAMRGINVVDPSPLDVFHKRWHTFKKSQLRLAEGMTANDRATMARDLRALADEIEGKST